MRRFQTARFLIPILLLLCLVLSGCQERESVEGIKYQVPADFTGAVIGSQTGTVFDDTLNSVIPDLQHKYFDDISGMVLALGNGDIDAVGLDEPVARLVAAQNPDLEVFSEIIQTDSYGLPITKGSALTAQMTELIEQYTADGTLEKLKEKWFSGDAERMHIDMEAYTGYDTSGGVIRYIHDSTQAPMSYVDDNGQSAGYEVELVLMAGKALSKKVEISQANFSALLTAVSSGKADIASGSVSITDERRESVDFPTSHYIGGIVLLCRRGDISAAAVPSEEKSSLFETISQSFQKTLIREDRWKLILSGLLVTILISLCALALGTLLGFFICLCRRSKKTILSSCTGFFIRFIQGIPLVVLLMVLYYMVFASTGLSGIVVAIIGFSLNFGVNSGEIIRGGIEAVDQGQREAAMALGMTRRQSFFKVILPQAIGHFLPAYKGEFINMMKMTSVVGYIAVQDLTKVSDIIRSRTYDAFFPLIINALIYLLLAWLLTSLMDLMELRLSSRKKKTPPLLDEGREAPSFSEIQPSDEEIIRLSHLSKEYDGFKVFTDVNASISQGERIAVIGPSGTGKSTLLRLINRLEAPTAGKLYIHGKDIADSREWAAVRKKTGMVFQSFNLFPHLSAIENVMLAPMTVLKMSRREAYRNALSLLRTVGLAEKAASYPDELSGGQKQRVAIARALAMKPEIILFDEPTSALDPTMVSEVLSVIRSLAKSGLTMLIVTHEMQFARDVATRIFYLDQETIYEDGTPQQIFDAPQRERTRQFIRRLKVLEEHIVSRDFDFIGINSRIEEFGRKHGIPQKSVDRLLVIFEELAVQTVLPLLPEDMALSILIEYAEETQQAAMYLRYNGEACDPTEGNTVSLVLVRNSCETMQYTCHPEEPMQNEIMVISR